MGIAQRKHFGFQSDAKHINHEGPSCRNARPGFGIAELNRLAQSVVCQRNSIFKINITAFISIHKGGDKFSVRIIIKNTGFFEELIFWR